MFSAASLSLRCQPFSQMGQVRCLAHNASSKSHTHRGKKKTSSNKDHVVVEHQQQYEQLIPSKERKDLSFKDLQSHLKQQARHSILVQYPAKVPQDAVIARCKQHGPINAHFHSGNNHRRFAVVEYSSMDSLKRLQQSTHQFRNDTCIPVAGRYLFFRNSQASPYMENDKDGTKWLDPTTRKEYGSQSNICDEAMSSAESLSDQITLIYDKLRLTEMGERLRYLVCSHIEEALYGFLPYSSVHPFGSTANGFGRFDCDLDMALDIGHAFDVEQPSTTEGELRLGMLYHVTKNRTEDDRRFQQNLLRVLAGILKHLLPAYIDVFAVLRARVPIVKFQQGVLGLSCDLCTPLNMSGTKMTEILYNLGQLDSRVRPLVFAVRHWAWMTQVTRRVPGPWISNFTLTMLVIHLLQTRECPVLPSVKTLASLPHGQPWRGGVEGSQSTASIGDLFLEFMDFYARFDFESKALSIKDATTFANPTDACMHLMNPVEKDHNISKNVQKRELTEFQWFCRNTVAELESKKFDKYKFWGRNPVSKTGLVLASVDLKQILKGDDS